MIQHPGVASRNRDVRPNAINRQQRQREQEAVPQVFNAEHVLHAFDESVHACFLRIILGQLYATTSNVPPALLIFSLADALKACPSTPTSVVSSPSPRPLLASRRRRTIPSAPSNS